MRRLILLALVTLAASALGVLVGFAVAHRDPPERDEPDGVQPADPYTFGLSESSGGTSFVITLSGDDIGGNAAPVRFAYRDSWPGRRN